MRALISWRPRPTRCSPILNYWHGRPRRRAVPPMTAMIGNRCFFRIMMARIEPFLGQDRICFLSHYPLSMAALAARDPNDPRVALRAEIYASGMELANGFVELTDATEQRQRLLADQNRRATLYGTLTPIDEDFLASLEYGMKPAMGMALGFDRLVMLCCEVEDINLVTY